MYAMGNNHYAELEAARQEFARYPNLQAIVLGCIAGNFLDWTLVKQELLQYVADRGACQKPADVFDIALVRLRIWDRLDGWDWLLTEAYEWWNKRGGRCNKVAHEWEFMTGGMAKNEAIIMALRGNQPFWEECWVSSSLADGHHVFTVSHGS